ncbi:DUF6258 family protein [Terrisporobacter mayombei]|uniref:Uncharacterized protein n=1 Tax=Terrisporobacter mayombei TaxID=1541 RepID=A0ABY9Q6U1_9FIRM|nr:DUF6258 family protein [Terrisporobacter mayombei]MCC3868917.1 hypothetical protein [Terrisporobacter mayombei]WMT82950.1 hypothetical protein TEMA_34480 [Terrisporobacter mayombei]
MNTIDFLKTLYFGDRYCVDFNIDNKKKEVRIIVNCISRIRSESGEWDYYCDEDIEMGTVVIHGVNEVILDKTGLTPNEDIYDIYATKIENELYKFTIEASYIDEEAETTDLMFTVIGEGVYLLDPSKPNIKITS